MSPELEIARQWVAKAQNDLLNADNNLTAANVPFDTVPGGVTPPQLIFEEALKALNVEVLKSVEDVERGRSRGIFAQRR